MDAMFHKAPMIIETDGVYYIGGVLEEGGPFVDYSKEHTIPMDKVKRWCYFAYDGIMNEQDKVKKDSV